MNFGRSSIHGLMKQPTPETNALENITKFRTFCSNCKIIFDSISFDSHICLFNTKTELIDLKTFLKDDPETISEYAFFQNSKDNDLKMKKILQNEFKINMKMKTKKSDPDVTYDCTVCKRKFAQPFCLDNHIKTHANDLIIDNSNELDEKLEIVIECMVCGRVLLNFADCINHLKNEHENLLCGNESDDQLEISVGHLKEIISSFIEIHRANLKNRNRIYDNIPLKVVAINSILQCEFCNNFYSNITDLLLHTLKHDPIKGFQCSTCNIYFKAFKDLFLHWHIDFHKNDEIKLQWSVPKYFVCFICQRKFTSNEQLYEHRYSDGHLFPRIDLQANLMRVSCEYCGETFTEDVSALKHYYNNHSTKIQEKDPSSEEHPRYLCHICGKLFKQSSNLSQHIRFHKGIRPFVCKVPDCGHSFTIRPDLNDHMRKYHTGERPYHCHQCGKRFLTGSVFYQHRRIHSGDRRYACDECGQRFFRAHTLKYHKRIHTGEKPFSCKHCSKCFRQRTDREKHIRLFHKNLITNESTQNLQNEEN